MRTRRKKQHRDTATQNRSKGRKEDKNQKTRTRRQELKPREDGGTPSGERVVGTRPRREDEMKGGEEVNPSTLRLREPSCIMHRWPHPWHARGGKGGSDFPVRGNRRRGRGRLPARGSSGFPRRRRCGSWPPRALAATQGRKPVQSQPNLRGAIRHRSRAPPRARPPRRCDMVRRDQRVLEPGLDGRFREGAGQHRCHLTPGRSGLGA